MSWQIFWIAMATIMFLEFANGFLGRPADRLGRWLVNKLFPKPKVDWGARLNERKWSALDDKF